MNTVAIVKGLTALRSRFSNLDSGSKNRSRDSIDTESESGSPSPKRVRLSIDYPEIPDPLDILVNDNRLENLTPLQVGDKATQSLVLAIKFQDTTKILELAFYEVIVYNIESLGSVDIEEVDE